MLLADANELVGHLGTLSYIYETVLELGDYYTITNQTFPAVSGNVFESRLVIGDSVPKSARAMGLTPATKDKEPVHGDLVFVENEGCQESDFPDSVAGNIALVAKVLLLPLSTTTRKMLSQVPSERHHQITLPHLASLAKKLSQF